MVCVVMAYATACQDGRVLTVKNLLPVPWAAQAMVSAYMVDAIVMQIGLVKAAM